MLQTTTDQGFKCFPLVKLPGSPTTKYTPKVYQLAPEKWWLEDQFPIDKVTFQGLC